MVVGLHERRSFRLSRQSSDASCLSIAIVEEEDDATDIKTDIVKSMKRPRKQGVTFDTETRIISIPSHKCLAEEERQDMFMTGEEFSAIRFELRELVLQTNAEHLAGSPTALPENDEKLRGLEVYICHGKHDSDLRKKNAFNAVFQNQYEGCDVERIAAEYAKVSVEAVEQAQKLAMMDQERAWSAEELKRSAIAPTNQIMDR